MNAKIRSLMHNRGLRFLLAVVFIMHLASNLTIPIIPVFLGKTRHFSIAHVGLILGVGSIAYQVGSLLGGLASDRWGRRNVMVAGSLAQATAMAGYYFSHSFWLFLFFSMINGLGVGFLAPTLKAKIADEVNSDERTTAFSWRGIAAHLGIILAGITITLSFTRNSSLFLYAAAGFVVLALAIRFSLHPDRCTGDHCPRTPLTEYKMILSNRTFLWFSGISLLIWALYAGFSLLLPLRTEYVLGSTASIGLLWTINSTSVVLLQGFVSRYILDRINPYVALMAGTMMLGAGLFFMGWATRFPTLSASAVTFIIGEMLFLPVLDSLVGGYARDEQLGAYFGIANFVSGIGTAIGTTLGGTMVERLGGVGSKPPWIAYGFTTILFVSIIGLFAYYTHTQTKMARHAAEHQSLLKRKQSAK